MAAPPTDEAGHSPTLPSFPEMILAAISALNGSNDTTKPAIVKYIETQYANLPADHESALADHLDKMKEGGQLVVADDGGYALAPPPRRGRGRPPKPKPAGAAASVVSPPRPRGRPPKPRDPNAPAAPSARPPRPRGRPPKRGRPAGAAGGPPRPRGRPPKAKSPFPVVGFD